MERWRPAGNVRGVPTGRTRGTLFRCNPPHLRKGRDGAMGTTRYGEVQDRTGLLLEALDSLSDNVAVWDSALRLLYANKALRTLWQADETAYLGKCLHELPFSTVEPEYVERPLRQTLQSGEPVAGGFPYLMGDEQCYAEFICTPLRDAEGRVAWVAGVARDATARKRAEASLQEADRRKDEFLATLAHELRNPLAAIRTSLEVMVLGNPRSRVQDEALETIERQSRQLTALVDDLLEVARIKQGKLDLHKRPVLLTDVLKAATEAAVPLMKQARQRLVADLPRSPIALYADPHRLAQVFTNLLNNASRYTPPEGRIDITASVREGWVSVAVRDTGAGISPEMKERIFELFVQAAAHQEQGYAGLGLGLTLTRSLVQMHGGRIEVESEGLGHGSTFRVLLPVVEDTELPEAEAEEVPILKARSRILVVDDNAPAARMLATLIDILGCEARTAFSGREALEVAEEFRPDIILMDLGMPEMNGFEAAAEIRSQPWGASVMLIALTGWGQDEDKRRTREADFDRHWVKPVELRDLQALLAERERGQDSD